MRQQGKERVKVYSFSAFRFFHGQCGEPLGSNTERFLNELYIYLYSISKREEEKKEKDQY
jgi:hypothetical protein